MHGNIDEVADLVRRRTGDNDLTISDVLDFFREHRRPTLADARRDAAAMMHAELGDRLRDALGLLDVSVPEPDHPGASPSIPVEKASVS
ncbi:MAG: hypothetical protein ACREM6_16455 [Vulcanimicrobiaceae bacterium]